MPQYVCVVDGFSSARHLPGRLRARGFHSIHVQSMPTIPDCFIESFNEDEFACNLVHDGDFATLAKRLRPFDVVAVVSGVDSGTCLADRLAAAIGVPGNSPATSALRRDKFLMGEAVRRTGLRAVRQSLAKTWAEAETVLASWQEFPLVVKPVASAGSDSVYFCDNIAQAERAVSNILGHANRIGGHNEACLIQERLRGQQYIVNSISRQAQHHIVEIWRDDRIQVTSESVIYDRESLLDRDLDALQALKRYAVDVLTALDFVHGPAHMEVMVADDGPCLIEVGARPQGGLNCNAIEDAIGDSQISLVADLAAENCRSPRQLRTSPALTRHITVVNMIARESGIVVQSRCKELMATLASFHSSQKLPAVGTRVEKTRCLFTSPGMVYLVHDDLNVLERDFQQIRSWEVSGALFDLTPEVCPPASTSGPGERTRGLLKLRNHF